MAGSQFREVALPLLMVSLWPDPRSYTLAILATLVPRTVLGRWFGRAGDRWAPRPLLVISYAIRMASMAGLLVASTLPVALAALVVGSVGTGLYQPAMSHYQARPGADRVAVLLARLRVMAGLMQAVLPAAAGLWMALDGRSLGFWLSLAAYGVAGTLMMGLPPLLPASGEAATRLTRAPLPSLLRQQMLLVAMVNGLAWVANMLYTAYLLTDLHVGAAGFGLALSLWGGAGLLSAWVLRHRDVETLRRWSWIGLLMMAGCWVVMTQPVGFWVVALLGVPEGFATWLLLDLLQASVLVGSSPEVRGQWSALAASMSAGGRIAGLAAVLAIPFLRHVHMGFLALAVAMVGVTAAALLAGRAAHGSGARVGQDARL
jgi:MFS family permease